jgi:hypothetical protein
VLMHNPIVDKKFNSEQFTHFLKNLCILGGLMVLASCSNEKPQLGALVTNKRR